MAPISMPLEDLSQKYFAFWLTREFLAADDDSDVENASDHLAVLVGSVVFVALVLVGLITHANV